MPSPTSFSTQAIVCSFSIYSQLDPYFPRIAHDGIFSCCRSGCTYPHNEAACASKRRLDKGEDTVAGHLTGSLLAWHPSLLVPRLGASMDPQPHGRRFQSLCSQGFHRRYERTRWLATRRVCTGSSSLTWSTSRCTAMAPSRSENHFLAFVKTQSRTRVYMSPSVINVLDACVLNITALLFDLLSWTSIEGRTLSMESAARQILNICR